MSTFLGLGMIPDMLYLYLRYVEAQDPRDQIALLENDTKLKVSI